MPTIKQINHIAILVDDIDSALVFWRDALGLELSHVEDVADQQSVVAFLPSGQSEIELVKPTTNVECTTFASRWTTSKPPWTG
jgi:methylmalonyl-CoA/ethylmalonyl-CoA epimerase